MLAALSIRDLRVGFKGEPGAVWNPSLFLSACPLRGCISRRCCHSCSSWSRRLSTAGFIEGRGGVSRKIPRDLFFGITLGSYWRITKPLAPHDAASYLSNNLRKQSSLVEIHDREVMLLYLPQHSQQLARWSGKLLGKHNPGCDRRMKPIP